MKRIRLLLATFAYLLCWLGAGLANAQTARTILAIAHVTVIDATGRPAQPDQTVVVAGGRIAQVGPAKRLKIPHDARVLDGRGKFLIPGLWDMHVHVAGISADPAWSKKVLLPVLTAYGITGVRDMGGDLAALLEW